MVLRSCYNYYFTHYTIMTTVTIEVSKLLIKLQDHSADIISMAALAAICQEIVDSETWLGLPVTRKYHISAPAYRFSPIDSDGKPTVVRDYFRELENALPYDTVTVEVQSGLQVATIQKNIGSMLKNTKNKKWKNFATSRSGNYVLVVFE